MRVARGSWESLGPRQGLAGVAENQVSRPMNLGLLSFRLFRTILCLLPGASVLDMVNELANTGRCEGQGPLGTGKY